MREYTVTYQQEVTRKVQAANISDAARAAHAWCTPRMRVMSIYESTAGAAVPPVAPDTKPDGA